MIDDRAREQFDAVLLWTRLLGPHGRAIFSGDTNHAVRVQRIRAVILNLGWSEERVQVRKPETYRQAFYRYFGESLGEK